MGTLNTAGHELIVTNTCESLTISGSSNCSLESDLDYFFEVIDTGFVREGYQVSDESFAGYDLMLAELVSTPSVSGAA